MQLKFYKYHGNGNDFIIIDNRQNTFPANNHALIKYLCNRNFGIGADGLMLMEETPGMDFHMHYYNSDGREGTMCGNGGRCMIHFAAKIGLIDKTAIFSGIDGHHQGRIDKNGLVHLKMQDVNKVKKDGNAYIINTGSPHYIIFTDNISGLDVINAGRKIRYDEKYGNEGINVNFVQTENERIRIRTYERGVENETLACGTGSVAAAIGTVLKENRNISRVIVETLGGILEVNFRRKNKEHFSDIWLSGPAKMVFEGNADIDIPDK
ncbi:MAG: diaminopimelate epimerase [Bacteroidales bacterium]